MGVGVSAFVAGMKGFAGFANKGAYRAGGVTSSLIKGGIGALQGRYGSGVAGAAWGGLTGGMYGAVSSDTSVLGGMMGGAAIGGGLGRYGGAGARGIRRAMRPSIGPRWPTSQMAMRGARAIGGQIRGDALLVSNRARNGFKALRKRMGR